MLHRKQSILKRAPSVKRPPRNTGAVSVFDQRQIAEFKEAFTKIDQDQDSFIDKKDLMLTLGQLGLPCGDKEVDLMLKDSPGSINFTMFLTMFGERMFGTDPEEDILKAFEAFDKNGQVDVTVLKRALTTMGSRMSKQDVDLMMSGFVADGKFQSKEWVRALIS